MCYNIIVMAKYMSLRDAKEQRREQKLYAAAGDPKAVKQEVKTLSRQLLVKDYLTIFATLVIFSIVIGFIVGINSSQGGGIVVIFWPIYLIVAVVLSIVFAIFSNRLYKKLEEIKKYITNCKNVSITTWVAIILCILIPVVLLGGPICFLLYLLLSH